MNLGDTVLCPAQILQAAVRLAHIFQAARARRYVQLHEVVVVLGLVGLLGSSRSSATAKYAVTKRPH